MNNRTHNQPAQKDQRRQLRTHGTSAEARLWLMLKNRQVEGMRFRRQFSIGPYILDFYCPEIRLCIELDGEQYFTQEGREHDDQRTEYLMRLHGIRVLRFENQDVFKYSEGVLNEIRNAIMECKVLQQSPYKPLRPTRGHLP